MVVKFLKAVVGFIDGLLETALKMTERMKHETYLKHEIHKRKMIVQSKESLGKRGYRVPDDVSTLSKDEIDELYQVIERDIDEEIKKLRKRNR